MATGTLEANRSRARKFAQLRLHLVVIRCCGVAMEVSDRELAPGLNGSGEYSQIGEYRRCNRCKRVVLVGPWE